MRVERQSGWRARGLRWPRLIAKCSLPCFPHATESDSGSDIQHSSLLEDEADCDVQHSLADPSDLSGTTTITHQQGNTCENLSHSDDAVACSRDRSRSQLHQPCTSNMSQNAGADDVIFRLSRQFWMDPTHRHRHWHNRHRWFKSWGRPRRSGHVTLVEQDADNDSLDVSDLDTMAPRGNVTIGSEQDARISLSLQGDNTPNLVSTPTETANSSPTPPDMHHVPSEALVDPSTDDPLYNVECNHISQPEAEEDRPTTYRTDQCRNSGVHGIHINNDISQSDQCRNTSYSDVNSMSAYLANHDFHDDDNSEYIASTYSARSEHRQRDNVSYNQNHFCTDSNTDQIQYTNRYQGDASSTISNRGWTSRTSSRNRGNSTSVDNQRSHGNAINFDRLQSDCDEVPVAAECAISELHSSEGVSSHVFPRVATRVSSRVWPRESPGVSLSTSPISNGAITSDCFGSINSLSETENDASISYYHREGWIPQDNLSSFTGSLQSFNQINTENHDGMITEGSVLTDQDALNRDGNRLTDQDALNRDGNRLTDQDALNREDNSLTDQGELGQQGNSLTDRDDSIGSRESVFHQINAILSHFQRVNQNGSLQSCLRSRQNTSLRSRQNISPEDFIAQQRWYYYDPRLVTSTTSGCQEDGNWLLTGPPSYDDIANDNQGQQTCQVTMTTIPDLPQDPPPPYTETEESPPPYPQDTVYVERLQTTEEEDANSNPDSSDHTDLDHIDINILNDLQFEANPEHTEQNNLNLMIWDNFELQANVSNLSVNSENSVPRFASGFGLGRRPPLRWSTDMGLDRWASSLAWAAQ